MIIKVINLQKPIRNAHKYGVRDSSISKGMAIELQELIEWKIRLL